MLQVLHDQGLVILHALIAADRANTAWRRVLAGTPWTDSDGGVAHPYRCVHTRARLQPQKKEEKVSSRLLLLRALLHGAVYA
jgi:hypothetical protein